MREAIRRAQNGQQREKLAITVTITGSTQFRAVDNNPAASALCQGGQEVPGYGRPNGLEELSKDTIFWRVKSIVQHGYLHRPLRSCLSRFVGSGTVGHSCVKRVGTRWHQGVNLGKRRTTKT